MAEKRSSFGAKLQLSDGAPTPVYTDIPGVGDFGFPLGQVETEDVTSHDSAGRWREFIQTVRDGGEISIPLQYDYLDVTHQALTAASGEFGQSRFRVIAPDATVLAEFDAFVGLDGTGALPVAGSINATLTLRTTGEVLLPFIT